jgi:FkbM family methyltransferase
MASDRDNRRLQFARLLCSRAPPLAASRLTQRLYPYERGKLDNHEFTIRTKTGSPFTGNTMDFHAHPVAVQGYNDWRNLAVALALCGPGDIIVEVGANVGTETVGYSDIVGARGRVVAFEPLPSNRAAVERLLPAFDHPNVTLYPYALSDRSGRARFAVPPLQMSQGTGHLLGAEEQRTETTIYYDKPVEMELIDVECRTLDELAAEVRGMRLLLADTEGAEVAILRGGRSVLGAERPALVLEASDPHLRRAGLEGVEDLHRELVSLGYQAFVMGRFQLSEVNRRTAGAWDSRNWLCLPRERMELLSLVRRSLHRCGLTPCIRDLNPMTCLAA